MGWTSNYVEKRNAYRIFLGTSWDSGCLDNQKGDGE
jgi:hypothetical protein